ncbi:MAG: peptidoglycan-binding domain-containing protein [Actinomycetaceae bacterium]|nr:peptidoglycan-binding domain-containing protein [Actinomycetaceae bacterium]
MKLTGTKLITNRKRAITVACSIAVAVALIVGTWFTAIHFQSPKQREAAAKPPAPTPALAKIEQGTLTDTFTVNAKFGGEREEKVLLTPPEGTRWVVTDNNKDVTVGGKIAVGQILFWANDRPVFAFDGDFPSYRDLKFGDVGSDVVQIQRTLQALGYGIIPDGKFGNATAAALNKLYRAHGENAPKIVDADAEENVDNAAQNKSEKNENKGAEKTAPSLSVNKNPKTPGLAQSEYVTIPHLAKQGAIVREIPKVGDIISGDNATIKIESTETELRAEVPPAVAITLNTSMSAYANIGGNKVPLMIKKIKASQDETNANPKTSDRSDAKQSDATAPTPTGGNAPDQSIIVFSGKLPKRSGNTGDTMLVTINRIATSASTLIVPKRAIIADSAGKTHLLVRQADGTYQTVAVTQKECVTGRCAIIGKVSPGQIIKVQ